MKPLAAALVAAHVAALAIAASTAAFAQDGGAASYDGTWAMTSTSPNGAPLEAEVVLKGDSGTWRTFARGAGAAKNNPCLLRSFPVAVQKSTTDELILRVDGSKVVMGCADYSATFKRVDDNSLDGAFDDKRAAHLARK